MADIDENIKDETSEEEVKAKEEQVSPDTEAADTAEAESSDSSESDVSDDAKDKKKLFGKKKDKKDKQIEELNAQISDYTDRIKRNMAEFDNYRKRTDKEKAAMFDMGAKSIIEKILPVVDNFERGLAAVPEDQKDDAFVSGMDKIYRQLIKMLDELDVKPIEAVGNTFDPNFHNAVMHVEDENLGENVVAQEFQKGYTFRGNVVRHSMVQVAN